MATCSRDESVRYWDLSTQKLVSTFIGHNGVVSSVILTGNYIVSGSYDRSLKLWELSDTEKAAATVIAHEKEVNSLANYKKIIASGSHDKTIKLWSLKL